MTCIASALRGLGHNESGEEDSFLLPPLRKRQARSNYGEGSKRVAGIPGENSGPFFSSSAGERPLLLVRLSALGMARCTLSRGWLDGSSLARLPRLGWHWLRSMSLKFSRYRRHNEDESANGALGSKIDSISKG